MAEQWNDVMTKAGDGVALGLRLHRFTLTLAALDKASFFLIEIDQITHAHLASLGPPSRSRIITNGSAIQNDLGLFASLLHGDCTKTADGDEPLRGRSVR